jgi:hypothetical protein
LNLRPPAPKAGALPDCATPRLGVHSLMPKNIRREAESEYRFRRHRVSMAEPQTFVCTLHVCTFHVVVLLICPMPSVKS